MEVAARVKILILNMPTTSHLLLAFKQSLNLHRLGLGKFVGPLQVNELVNRFECRSGAIGLEV